MVAQAHDNRNDETRGVPQTRLMRAETEAYVENQRRAESLRNVSSYVNWAATGLLGLTLVLGGTALGLPLLGGMSLPISAWAATAIAGGLSAIAFITNLTLSTKATEISERGNVLYSDIDSQNQAHRMVQAFAKAQTQGRVQADDASPMTSTAPSWAERTGGPRQQAGSWQERVTAEASREEAQSLAAIQQFSR